MATIKGVWIFNDDPIEGYSNVVHQTINFISNGNTYTSLEFTYDNEGIHQIEYGATVIYHGYGGFTNDDYKTVDFGTTEQTVSDEFLTCMQANATPADAVTIEYNGTVIASLKPGQTATLFTKNKKMESDIIVVVPQSESSETIKIYDGECEIAKLISFTIDGTSYQAEEGMTWMEWCESEYNTNEYYCNDSSTVQWGGESYVTTTSGAFVSMRHSIEAGATYYLTSNSPT